MAKLTHNMRRALRDAALTGGLHRCGLSEMFSHPTQMHVVYFSQSIDALVRSGMMVRVPDGTSQLAKCTTAGLAALSDSWRPDGAAIPAGSIVELQPA